MVDTTGNDAREPWRRPLLLALPVVAFLLGCTPMSDFDVWWHLRTGQLILETGHVPRLDPFTYTNAGRAWTDVYWMYQVGIALLYRLGGATALVLLKALAGAGIVALSALGRRPQHRAWPLALAWLPALLMLSGRLSERPELVSLVLLAATLVILGRAPRAPRGLWALPALQVLWVNCHGAFLMGPLVLSAYALEWVGARDQLPPRRIFLAVTAATWLACLVNPYGFGAIRLSLQQLHKVGPGLYRSTIGELKSVGDFMAAAGLWNPYLLAYFAALLLGAGSFVACARRACLRPFRLVIFAAGAYLGWQATRNNGLCAVIAVMVTTWNLDDALAAGREATPAPAKRSRRRGPATPAARATRWPAGNLVLLAALGALALATVSGGLYAWAGEGRRLGLGERPRWFAHDACAFLARPDLPARVIAYNISQASVCIAHGAPAHKQFMDPRLEVIEQSTFERYLDGIRRLWRGDATWEQPLGIDHDRPDEVPAILIERGPLGRAADMLGRDPRWRCVFADDLATVFVTTRLAEQHALAPVPWR
jgi:hypothetical protein